VPPNSTDALKAKSPKFNPRRSDGSGKSVQAQDERPWNKVELTPSGIADSSLPTLRWRKQDSNRRYRVTRPGFREGLISPLLDSLPTENSARNGNRHHDDAGCLPRYRWFESCSLRQRVCELSVPERRTVSRDHPRNVHLIVTAIPARPVAPPITGTLYFDEQPAAKNSRDGTTRCGRI
jgi:hypothetical protein